MSRGIVGAGVVALLVLVLLIWGLRPKPDGDGSIVISESGEPVAPGEGIAVRLFFAAGDGLLHLEPRTLVFDGPIVEAAEPAVAADAGAASGAETGVVNVPSGAADGRHVAAALVVRALLQEPETEGLRRVFEEGTELAEVRLTSDGVAVVSLQPAPGSVNRGLGSRAELLRVYSLVNSLAYSVEGVQSVIIVWAGSQPQTMAGHVDTTRPLLPSLGWVARESRERLSANAGPAS